MSNKDFSLDLENESKRDRGPVFHGKGLDFVERPVNNDLWFLAHATPEENKTPRFVVLSSLLHGSLFAALMVFSGPLFTPPEVETVTIEIADLGGPIPAPARQMPAQKLGSAIVPRPSPSAAEIAGPDDVTVAPPAQATRASQPISKPTPVKAQPVAKARPVRTAPVIAKQTVASTVTPVVAESEVEVPETIDSLEADQLDEAQFKAQTVGDFQEGDLDSTFAKVDENHADPTQDLKNDLERDSESLAEQDLSAIDRMDEETRQQAELLAAKADALKRKNAEKLAAAVAAENAARARAEREGAAKAAAAAAANEAAGRGQGRGNPNGAGKTAQGQGGSATGSGAAGSAFGVPSGIRSLEQLKQMPGNPKPRYSVPERLAGQQGEVVFVAYISKSGLPTSFRQMRSTGYANLDGKTLTALKQWKFYPGQEGWVEIPFRWDLRGGPQETSALGRRVGSKK